MRTGETTFRTSRSQAQPPTLGARPRRGARAGFTLTEIMIAMGVLAIGMGMVAGALHAGIQLHVRTIDDIMRQLIGDNALAVVQARVRHSAENGITGAYKLLGSKEGDATSYFGPQDMKYPQDITTPPTPYGAAVFMKRRDSFNDYDIMIVPYTVTPSTPTGSPSYVNPTPFVGTIEKATSGSTITTTASVLKVGSVVIDTRDNIVRIFLVRSAASTTKAEFSESIPTGTNVQLITLTPETGTDRIECSKPVQTKTALSPKPGWTPGSN
jgi:prepilin-type N-terminal cleavage/methylation domain-containing protein